MHHSTLVLLCLYTLEILILVYNFTCYCQIRGANLALWRCMQLLQNICSASGTKCSSRRCKRYGRGRMAKGCRSPILIFMYTLSALSATSTTCGAAESHSESCGDREGSEIVIPAHSIALEAHNFRGYPPSAKILLP